MASEPIFIAQTYTLGPASSQEWFRARAAEAQAEGCTWFRMTHDPDRSFILIEGWLERPDDEGEPRWMVTDEPDTAPALDAREETL